MRCVFDLVLRLQAAGHTITIDANTRVRIAPAVHEDLLSLLDTNWGDVEAVLDADHQDPAMRWTMPAAATVH